MPKIVNTVPGTEEALNNPINYFMISVYFLPTKEH